MIKGKERRKEKKNNTREGKAYIFIELDDLPDGAWVLQGRDGTLFDANYDHRFSADSNLHGKRVKQIMGVVRGE